MFAEARNNIYAEAEINNVLQWLCNLDLMLTLNRVQDFSFWLYAMQLEQTHAPGLQSLINCFY